jgi:hypothetical protein
MTGKRRLASAGALLVFALVATAPCAAWAQPGARTSDAAETDALFKKGLGQFDSGDNAGAIATWERLLTMLDEDRAWKLLFNLGLAYQAAGDATRAVERYEGFLHKMAEQPGRPKPELEARRVEVVERVRKIKATHGGVRVLAHPTRDVMVKVDDSAPRATGFTAYLLPGDHVVEVQPGTPQARRIPVRAVAATTTDVETAEPASPQPPPPVTPTPTPTPPPPRAAQPRAVSRPAEAHSFPTGWLVAGAVVTAASTALPIALGVAAKSKKDDAIALGAGHTGYRSAVDDFRSARTLYEVSWVVPAVLATATVIIVLASAGSDEKGKAVAALLGAGRRTEAAWTPGAL